MSKADNDEESQSEKVGTGHQRQFQIRMSPISAQPSGADNGDNEVDAKNTNYKNPMAASVEENISVPQSLLPPPALEDSNKNHNCTRPSQNVRANNAKAQENDDEQSRR